MIPNSMNTDMCVQFYNHCKNKNTHFNSPQIFLPWLFAVNYLLAHVKCQYIFWPLCCFAFPEMSYKWSYKIFSLLFIHLAGYF